MIYQEFSPSLKLHEDLRCFWVGGGANSLVIPDGCSDILFKFRNGELDNREFLRAIYVGAATEPIWVESSANTWTLGVRFRPGSASRYFDFSMVELTDGFACLEDLWEPGRVRKLGEQLCAAETVHEKIALLEGELVTRQQPARFDTRFFEWAWTRAELLTVESMASELHLSRQHLRRLCLLKTGLSPKDLLLIARVHRLSESGRESLKLSDGGFYDQAHLIRQFKRFTGLTPREYFRKPWQDRAWRPPWKSVDMPNT